MELDDARRKIPGFFFFFFPPSFPFPQLQGVLTPASIKVQLTKEISHITTTGGWY